MLGTRPRYLLFALLLIGCGWLDEEEPPTPEDCFRHSEEAPCREEGCHYLSTYYIYDMGACSIADTGVCVVPHSGTSASNAVTLIARREPDGVIWHAVYPTTPVALDGWVSCQTDDTEIQAACRCSSLVTP
ncbi:MAG: hypothetical protein CMH57_09855 [Myxococcales bacterium]|nr:hypothetical protein [Myxococcales bacterium]